MLTPKLLTKVGLPRLATPVSQMGVRFNSTEECGQEVPDCSSGMGGTCDMRDTTGLSGGECVQFAVKSPMDKLWYNHKEYFPRIKNCFRITSKPSDYRPGEDPNSNHQL